MRILGLLCLSLTLAISLHAQSSYSGEVHTNDNCSKEGYRTPVPDAVISAEGVTANSTQQGKFSLYFPGKQPNETVTITIRKTGYEPKKVTVRTCKPCNAPDIHILCKSPGGLAQAQQNVVQNKEKQALIQAQMDKSPKDSEEYKALLREMEKIKRDLKSSEEEFQRLSAQATDKDWKLFSYQLQELLSNTKVSRESKHRSGSYNEDYFKSLDSLWADSDTLSLAEKTRRNIRKNELKALFYSFDYQFDKSAQCYRKLLELDPNNLDYAYSYAVVLSIQDKNEEAIAQLEKALSGKSPDNTLYIKCSNWLASLYIETSQNEKAKALLDKNLSQVKAISRDTSQYSEKKLLEAKVYELYAVLYFAKNLFDNSIAEYKKAKEVYAGLNKVHKGAYLDKYASVNTKLARVYSSIKNYNEAMRLCNESLAIYEDLAKDGDMGYFLSKCEVALDMANLFYVRNDYLTAEGMYNKLSPIFRDLAAQDPAQYQEYFAKILFAEGKMLQDQKHYYSAEQKFGEVLSIYQRLHHAGLGNFNAQIASTLNARGKSLYSQKKMAKCKKDYDAALVIHEGLAKKAPDSYEPSLADSYNYLGSYFLSAKNLDSAYYYYDKALKICKKFDEKDKRVYRLSLIQNKQSMASYYFDQKQSKAAIKEIEEAYVMAQELVRLDTAVFLPDYATTVLTLGMVYMDEKENEVAITKFKEAYEIFERLSKEQPDVYELPKATIQYALGTLHSYKNEERKAQAYFDEAVAICQKQLEKNTNAYAPILAAVYMAKTEISKKRENYQEALKNLEESEKWFVRLLSSTNLDEYREKIGNIKIQMAQICIFTKDYQRAEKVANEGRQFFSDLMENDPENKNEYRAKLATIERGSGDLNMGRGRKDVALDYYRRAQKYYKELRNVSPPDFHVEECKTKILIGEAQQSLGNEQNAIVEFKSVIDTVSNILRSNPAYEKDYLPTLADAHKKLGSLNFKNAPKDALGNFGKAVELYKKAEGLSKESYNGEIAIIYLNTGFLYYNLQAFEEAIAVLQGAIKYVDGNPNAPNYHTVMISANHMVATIYFRVKDFDLAMEAYSKCLEFDQKLPEYLSPLDILETKTQAGISYIKSSDGTKKASGENILRAARTYGNRQSWPADQRSKVDELLMLINDYID